MILEFPRGFHSYEIFEMEIYEKKQKVKECVTHGMTVHYWLGAFHIYACHTCVKSGSFHPVVIKELETIYGEELS